jgi:hypothetical protein
VLTGKNVPDRNIIGKVIRLPTTAADSTLVETVPTSIPRDTKRNGPMRRNGMIHRVNVICAPKAKTPTSGHEDEGDHRHQDVEPYLG